MSEDGISWRRGHGGIAGARGAGGDADVGRVLEPNQEEWWWLDTRHLSVSDVQARSRAFSAPSLHRSCCPFWGRAALPPVILLVTDCI